MAVYGEICLSTCAQRFHPKYHESSVIIATEDKLNGPPNSFVIFIEKRSRDKYINIKRYFIRLHEECMYLLVCGVFYFEYYICFSCKE